MWPQTRWDRMKQARRCAAGLLLLVGAVSLSPGDDRALLVGVGDYRDASIPSLPGCQRDAVAMQHLLIDDYGFVPANVRLLCDRDATRAAILGALDSWLAGGTHPGDLVLIYFSGYGSKKKSDTQKPDEPDGYDELLCPVDYDAATQANAIVDDELADRLAALDGRNIVVILDAAHSGTMTKSIKGLIRSIEVIDTEQSMQKYLPPPIEDDQRPGTGNSSRTPKTTLPGYKGAGRPRTPFGQSLRTTPGADRVIDEVKPNHIVLASCGDAQTAEHIRVKIGDHYIYRSAFTWLLVEGLSGPADASRDGRITYDEAVAYTRRRLRDPRYDLVQTPELLARPEFRDQPFLGLILTSRGLGKVVHVAGGRATINRGAQHGVQTGYTYEPAETGYAAGQTVLRIDTLEEFLSSGVIEGNGDLQVNMPVRPRELRYTPGELCVWIADPPNSAAVPDLRRMLTDQIAATDGMLVVDDPRLADCTVRVAREFGALSASIYSRLGTLRSAQQDYRDVHQLVADVRRRLCGELWILRLARLETMASDVDLQLRVEGGRSDFIVYRDPNKWEPIRFGFRASRDCYVTLLSIDSAGTIRTLLREPHFHVHAGLEYTLPPTYEEPNRIQPPPGRDFVFALATQEPIDVNMFAPNRLCDCDGRAALQVLIRGIGPRPNNPTPTEDFSAGVTIPSNGWAVAKVTVDTYPEK